MNKEEMEALEKLALERNMTVEEINKYREYSSRSLNGEEWIEYLKLCEKAFKNTSKYLYLYEHEIREINKYIDKLKEQRQELRSWLEESKKIAVAQEHIGSINAINLVLDKLSELEEGKNE